MAARAGTNGRLPFERRFPPTCIRCSPGRFLLEGAESTAPMHHPFPALVILGLVPLTYFAHRFALLELRAIRRALAALGVAALAFGVYAGGVDFEVLKRVKLFIALLVIAGMFVTEPRRRR